MTLIQFVEAVEQIAHGRFCSARVETAVHASSCDRPTKRYKLECDAYIEGIGWTKTHVSPDDVLAELRGAVDRAAIVAVGEIDTRPGSPEAV